MDLKTTGLLGSGPLLAGLGIIRLHRDDPGGSLSLRADAVAALGSMVGVGSSAWSVAGLGSRTVACVG